MSYQRFDEFLRNLAQGDDKAWQQFMIEFSPLIMSVAKNYNPLDPEDIAQEVFEALIKSGFRLIAQFSGPRPAFLVYLKNIAANIARNSTKKSKNRASKETELSETLYDNIPDTRKAPEELLLHKYDSDEITESITGLKLIYREVLLLHLKGYGHTEIAAILRIPVNTAITRFHRAVGILKKVLNSEINKIA